MEQFSEFFENLAFMTFSHDRFWVLCAIIVAVILVYQLLLRFAPKTVGPVHHFLQRHPLIWICIPAALLIYFVYVSLGWNLWVSVSDWESGQLEASYGWGGFGNYAKMFSSPDFWPSLRNTLLLFCLIPLCLLLGLGLALIMDQGLHGALPHADSAAVRAVFRRDRHGLGVHVPSDRRRAEFLPLDSGR